MVTLDDYIGLTKNGDGYWVLSCGSNEQGTFLSCTKEGVDNPSCS